MGRAILSVFRTTAAIIPVLTAIAQQSQPVVGPAGENASIVPTSQLVHPAGPSIEIAGRPVNLAQRSTRPRCW